MFEAIQLAPAEVVWQSSALTRLGVRHLFTTKAWNVRSAEDVVDVIDTARWFPPDTPPRVVLSKQVHGCGVDTPSRRLIEADAHVTDDPQEAVAVRTADCVPVLLSAVDGRVVAAIHAGWRGLDPSTNVITQAVESIRELTRGNSTARLVAAIGPCVSVERYEVGEEVASRFRPRYPQAVRDDLGKKPHLDTRAVAVAQLRESGLTKADLDVFPGCTFDDADSFFSYRREGPGVGHLAAVIAPFS